MLSYLAQLSKTLCGPKESSLTILRSLSIRILICTLLKVFDSPNSLILVANATAEEENGIGQQLGVMGVRNPGLRVVDFEMTSKKRVIALDSAAFITRLYQEKHQTGFLKAFTDQPQQITSGISPLTNILKELEVRTVHIYSRSHDQVQESLERRRAHTARADQIIARFGRPGHKKAVYFRSFDLMVRSQLDPVGHNVGPGTKNLVNDLTVLRKCRHSSAEKRGDRIKGDAGWEVLDEFEGISRRKSDEQTSAEVDRLIWEKEHVDPVLEEPPKWGLLADVLYEIETMINDNPSSSLQPGSNTVLVLTFSSRTCSLLRDYLDRLDPSAAKGEQDHRMIMGRLRGYLDWKAALHGNAQAHVKPSFNKASTQSQPAAGSSASGESGLSEATQWKDRERQMRIANRRRIRGGASGYNATSQRTQASQQQGLMKTEGVVMEEAEQIADFLEKAPTTTEVSSNVGDMIDFDGPRFIVIYEPNQDFIRSIEVYRNSDPGLGVRVYFIFYSTTCEEHRHLAGLRTEKESFERLIEERSSMMIPIHEQRRVGSDTSDDIVRTINTRIAGGGKTAAAEPPLIIVNQREFRSTLPNLLHASNLKLSLLRWYTQCELMCVHYKQPILLIKFEEHKSFSLETVSEMKSYVKPTGKYPIKKKQTDPSLPGEAPAFASIQSRLVLLMLTFPRVAGWNLAVEELLRTLPGMIAKNARYVMGKVSAISELCSLKLE
ncbi:hypothetical protein M422DRAFT_32128 [Sphaerobolus stellatus SS14]|uniref:Uncharacterized protein n=1 Tax=Sphaerobolus stellatus (strain SS14) TaxID=990650 RepID=A0A0C9VRL4_SPHS4|nr:hypothetical protein M422DRAFT_32128 [Sphaerobolus stellatus SS14]